MSGSMLKGLFWGLVVGAGAALIFAPQSGRDTRGIIAEKSRQAKEKASEVASSATQRAHYMSEKIKQSI